MTSPLAISRGGGAAKGTIAHDCKSRSSSPSMAPVALSTHAVLNEPIKQGSRDGLVARKNHGVSSALSAGNSIFWPALVFLFFLAAWQLVVVYTHVPVTTLPAPSNVLAALIENREALMGHTLHTLFEALAGFLFAACLGLAIGLAMNLSQFLRDMLYPNLVALQVIPKIALAPLFIVWFGIGAESKLILATFISFFPVAIGTATGLMETDAGALRLCRVLQATRLQTLIQVRLPYALPFVFSGLKVASTMAMIGVVVAEFISAQRGLGYFILNASSRIDTPAVMAAIVLLCISGMGLFALTDLLERAIKKRWWPQ